MMEDTEYDRKEEKKMFECRSVCSYLRLDQGIIVTLFGEKIKIIVKKTSEIEKN